jgi:hypothetical protein
MNVLTYFNIFIKVVCFYHMYLYNGLQTRYGYLTVPFTPPPQKYFSLQPIVHVHKIKTHNFYEIKVDF